MTLSPSFRPPGTFKSDSLESSARTFPIRLLTREPFLPAYARYSATMAEPRRRSNLPMRSPAQHITEATLRARFGPEALITRLGTIWMVHLDQPSEAEIQERLAEIERDILEPEDCSLCDLLQLQVGDVLIYDGPMCHHEPAPWRDRDPNPHLN